MNLKREIGRIEKISLSLIPTVWQKSKSNPLRKSEKIFVLLCFLLLWKNAPLFGEVIQLKSGLVIQGEILSESEEELTVKTSKDVVKIQKKLIQSKDPVRTQEEANKDKTSQVNIEVYLTNWCPYCQKLEKYLRSNNIPYTRYDIEHDMLGKQKYKKLGGKGVPLITVDDYVLAGFNPQRLKMIIQAAERRRRSR